MIRVFGPAKVDGDGQLSGRDRQVLAALVVMHGHPTSPELLADAMYGDTPPATWRKVVQGSIVRLRGKLGRHAIETSDGGYRLSLGGDHIDVQRFERLVGEARELRGVGDDERASPLLEDALSLVQGDPFTDLDGWDPARAEVARLRELRLLAEEALVDAMLAGGEHRDAAAAAAANAEAEPLREQRWAALALAHYRGGRQAHALRALGRCRALLREELGVDPSPQLAALEQAILTQDPALAATDDPVVADQRCPYRGLSSYGVADADDYFGREVEVDACLERLGRTGFVVVVGPSGCGKSSFAQAGVAARVARGGGEVAVVRPSAAALSNIRGDAAVRLLVVDQLEELFTADLTRTELERFATALEEVARTTLVLATLRADHVGSCAAIHPLADRVETGIFMLRPMSEDDLRAAVEGPARRAGLRLEPGLVELLVRDAVDQPGGLPLLSHALSETWARRDGRTLTVDAYRSAGGVAGSVSQTAERAVDAQTREGRRIARELFLRLVAVGDGSPVRQTVPLSDLALDEQRSDVLDALVRARLLTVDGETATVAHEAIASAWPRLRTWLDEDREWHRLRHHLAASAHDWDERSHDDSELYRGGRLRTVEEWVATARPALTPTEQAFLEASLAAREKVELDRAAQIAEQTRVNRRLRRSLAAIGVLLVLALVAGSVAVAQSRQAADQQALAEDVAYEQALASLVSRASARRDTDPALAGLLALAAHRLDPRPETYSALLGTFTSDPTRERAVPLAERSTSGALLPDGRTFVVDDWRGGVRLVDLETGAIVSEVPGGDDQLWSRLAVSADGRRLAQVTSDGTRHRLVVRDLAAGAAQEFAVELPFRAGSVLLGPDASIVVVAGGNDGAAEIRSGSDGALLHAITAIDPGGPAELDALSFTAATALLPDGALVITSRAGPLRVVDLATGAERTRLDGPPNMSDTAITLSPDGTTAFAAGVDGTVAWDLERGELAWQRDDTRDCSSLAALPDAVLCGLLDGTVVSLDPSSGERIAEHGDNGYGDVHTLAVATGGLVVVEAANTGLVVRRLDGGGAVATTVPGTEGKVPWRHVGNGQLLVTEFSPTANVVFVSPMLVDTDQAAIADEMKGVIAAAPGPLSHPDWLVALFAEGAPSPFYDATTRAPVELDPVAGDRPRPNAGRTPARGAEPLADGVLFADKDGIWAIDDQARPAQPQAQVEGEIVGLWVSVEHERLMVRTARAIEPRRLDTGEPTGEAPLPWATSMAIGGDRIVVADGATERLVAYDTATLAPVGDGLPVTGLYANLSVDALGSRVAAATVQRTVQVVDLDHEIALGTPIDLGAGGLRRRGFQPDARAALSPDGQRLSVGTEWGVVVWDLRPDALEEAACRIAGRDLTPEEWDANLAAIAPYRTLC